MSTSDDGDIVEFYRKNSWKVLGYLINMGTDAGLAEEITDDAFLVAARNWQRICSYDYPEGYVFAIAKNERSRRQQCHSRQARDLQPDPHQPVQEAVTDPAEHVIDRIVLRQALQRLRPRLREAVTLRHILDLSVAETAAIMGISQGAVKRYTAEGLHGLASFLADSRTIADKEMDR